jgi:hypothetical protein
MKLEEQVVSLELSKKLRDLGVEQESLFYYVLRGELLAGYELCYRVGESIGYLEQYFKEVISAFTVAELGEILPPLVTSARGEDGVGWYIMHDIGGITEHVSDMTEANARAKMLIELIEKGIVKP